ncbi:MAG TPA: TIGR02301 family protein [Caulobacterales bacterium]|nr:TIGR02301 family protein [Caulobacterales bacterium]
MRLRLHALVAALALASAPAAAQTPPPTADQEAWYGQQLVQLSEVLGGSHYLRILCEGRGDQTWRNYMRGVIQREPRYNAQLVEGFNRGYRQQEARFPTCDRDATQMADELRAQGVRLAGALRARQGR